MPLQTAFYVGQFGFLLVSPINFLSISNKKISLWRKVVEIPNHRI